MHKEGGRKERKSGSFNKWDKKRGYVLMARCSAGKLAMLKDCIFSAFSMSIFFQCVVLNFSNNVLAFGAVVVYGAQSCQYTTKVDAR